MLACLSAAILFAAVCGVAEARTIYTIAGGGGLPPPKVGEPPVPATAISLADFSSLARVPGGNLLISTGTRGQRLLVLDAHGMVRAVRPPAPPVVGVDRFGIEYAVGQPGRLLLRRPGGSYEAFASLYEVVPFFPTDMLVHPEGGVLLAATVGVVRVMPDGSTVRVAGTGQPGHSDDGVPAREAGLRYPTSLALAADGALLIADRDDNRVRRVDPLSGTITTIAGSGQKGFGATAAQRRPRRLTGPPRSWSVRMVDSPSRRRTGAIASAASAGQGLFALLREAAPRAGMVGAPRC